MAAGERQVPDWRDAAAYAPLLHVDRSFFAWEWLRRDSSYRQAAEVALARRSVRTRMALCEEPQAAAWGLHAFEDPALVAPLARPVWRSDRFAPVIRATAEPWRQDSDALDPNRLETLATLIRGRKAEHVLLSDGQRSVRLDTAGVRLDAGPLRLRFGIAGFGELRSQLPALRQLAALAALGRFAGGPHPPVGRARRMVLMLRARDAVVAGATQRSIAAELLSGTAGETRWRVRSPSLRSQVQRLVRSARLMASGGFWELLSGPMP